MNMLINTIMQKKKRIDYMIDKYNLILESLPKGTLQARTIKSKTYYYLKYREGKKVVSKYINKADVGSLQQQIEKRQHIESMLKSLITEQKTAAKILEDNNDSISW